ncbi:unnamed protein product [Urochloa humidicola]
MTLEALCAPRSDVLVYDTFNAAAAACAATSAGSFLFGVTPAVDASRAPAAQAGAEGESCRAQQGGRRKRRRRQRSVRSAADAESQRMTHIAVERNRRRQMNEYLASLRSLMPDSYVHRSDQASIVSGAIDFVKELEQQLQSLEAQKLALQQRRRQRGDTAAAAERDAATAPFRDPAPAAEDAAARQAAAAERPPFAWFFRYPQYAWRHAPPREDSAAAAAGVGADEASRASAVADVEVGVVVDAHASLHVMAPRRPGQLLKMVAAMQALGLAVLHLNVTAALGGELALYTLSLKVEEGCGLTTAEDIAAAAHHVLCIIDAEAATAHRLLALGAGQPERLVVSTNPAAAHR